MKPANRFATLATAASLVGALLALSLHPRKQLAGFMALEQLVIFCQLGLALFTSGSAAYLTVIQQAASISSLFLPKAAVVLLAVASAAAYASLGAAKSHYALKAAHGAAGCFYAFAAVLQTDQRAAQFSKGAIYAFAVCSSIQVTQHDVFGAVIQIVVFATLSSVVQIRSVCLALSVVFACVSAQGLVQFTMQRLNSEAERLQRLQSHAVMNAYVTMRE